jgi:hypothetical protein
MPKLHAHARISDPERPRKFHRKIRKRFGVEKKRPGAGVVRSAAHAAEFFVALPTECDIRAQG